MNDSLKAIKLLALSLVASLLTHIVVIYGLDLCGSYELTRPVMIPRAVMVDLTAPTRTEPGSTTAQTQQDDHKQADQQHEQVSAENERSENISEEEGQTPEPDRHVVSKKTTAGLMPDTITTSPTIPEAQEKIQKNATVEIAPPLRSAAEFMSAAQETLSYRISLLGLPVGSGVLHAKQEKGDVRITLRVTSSLVISSIYPVDDLIETRLLGGNYIITKIKQQEGSFRGDRGFTLFLREKNVFWIDLLKKTSTKESLPGSDVVDILSGLYYLRNRPLQIGKTETLHIFDSNIYTAVPVEVLRREKVALPGLKSADTLLLHPLIKTEGIFKRDGDIFIWVTDDVNHVPVKVETTIKLGKVTAELVSAEVRQKRDEKAQKP